LDRRTILHCSQVSKKGEERAQGGKTRSRVWRGAGGGAAGQDVQAVHPRGGVQPEPGQVVGGARHPECAPLAAAQRCAARGRRPPPRSRLARRRSRPSRRRAVSKRSRFFGPAVRGGARFSIAGHRSRAAPAPSAAAPTKHGQAPCASSTPGWRSRASSMCSSPRRRS
jgi:hypothetical protein